MSNSDTIQPVTPFRIGDFEVDPLNNLLLHNSDSIKLEPKVMDVLVYLANRPGQVVSREELEEKVWTGRIVTYDALTATIVKLRKAFQTHNKHDTIIKTIPKRGYSLVAPVTPIKSVADPSTPPATAILESEDKQTLHPEKLTPVKTENARSEHERRQVTVLSCELTLITESMNQPDPEEQHDLYKRFHEVCAEVVHHYGGHIGQYTNGQLIIYFGYPVAHEGDAERAIHTGHGIIDAVKTLSGMVTSDKKDLSVRIGIHSGLVIVGETADSEQHERMSIVGDTPMVANALKNSANPNTVVIGESTKRLVEHWFAFDSVGLIKINQSQSINAFQAQNTASAINRFEAKLLEGLTPLVGREIEIELLLKRWEETKTCESQVVCLCADAGIGKSRILQGLQECLQSEEHNRVMLFCSPYHVNSSLYPLIVYLENILNIHSSDNTDQSLDKLETLLSERGLQVAETAPVFAELLSLPGKTRYTDFEPEPQELKNRILECLVLLFNTMAKHKPLLFIVEDAHWLDPTTRELIDLLIKELSTQRILFVTSYRPEFDPPWSGYMQATLLRLNRLSKTESATIIKNVTGGKFLPENILEQIIAKTDGVPLFIEELTKNVLTSEPIEEGTLRILNIPESLQDLLMERLDKLKASKQIAQLASILGRTFSLELLRAVADENETALEIALSELVNAELIFRRGVPPDISYEFKHALVQNAAYQSLLKSTRQKFHQNIAKVLQKQFPQISKSQPEVLAHHYTEAQQYEQAIPYWLRAGQRACEHSANIEAIAHLNKGLELVSLLPDSPARIEHELRFLLVLGPALLSAKGLGARDAEKVYLRARELCRETDELAELFTVTWGLWLLCQKRGRLNEAQTFSSELLALAEKLNDQEYHLQAHHAAWTTSFRLSAFQSCDAHTKQGLKLYDADLHRSHATRFGSHDPGVCAYYNAAMTQWLLGYADQARVSVQQAVNLAQEINHPFSQVLAHVFAGFIAQCCGEPEQVKSHTQIVEDVCGSLGIAPDCAAQARVLDGWVETQTGKISSGIHEIEQAFMSHHSTGVRTHEPYLLSILADSYARAEQVENGLRVIADAFNSISETGERTFEAEIYRLKGELLLVESDKNLNEAQNCFQGAIAIAKQQQAKSLELRAAMSLFRSQTEQQRNQLGAQTLQPLYSEFHEGFDTADLRTAATILNQLQY